MTKENYDYIVTAALSYAQSRLWFLDKLLPNSSVYNISSALHIKGHLEHSILEQAFKIVISRHEALRTKFVEIEGGGAQVIEDNVEFSIPIHNKPGENLEQIKKEIEELCFKIANKPFNLSSIPLLRVELITINEAEQVLILVMHHIISDGWSMGILAKELMTSYELLKEGKEVKLPELPIQYADYAIWQREWLKGEVLEKQLKYWKEQLKMRLAF